MKRSDIDAFSRSLSNAAMVPVWFLAAIGIRAGRSEDDSLAHAWDLVYETHKYDAPNLTTALDIVEAMQAWASDDAP